MCSQLVEHVNGDVLAECLERFGGEVGRLTSNLARRLPDAPAPQSSDPETERFLLFKAMAELLRAVAASVPLCVVLDDFHWADGQSVALLKHVARTVEHDALQLLVTYRDSEPTKDHSSTGVLADLRRIDGVERIALADAVRAPLRLRERQRTVVGVSRPEVMGRCREGTNPAARQITDRCR